MSASRRPLDTFPVSPVEAALDRAERELLVIASLMPRHSRARRLTAHATRALRLARRASHLDRLRRSKETR